VTRAISPEERAVNRLVAAVSELMIEEWDGTTVAIDRAQRRLLAAWANYHRVVGRLDGGRRCSCEACLED
jgi:hypothetical protein